jgi:acyl-CoA thioesterase-1
MRKRGKQWRTAATAGILVCTLSASHSTAAAQHDSSRGKRLVVLGDSLSQGYLLKPSEAWPMLIVEKLRAARLNFEVTNASQTGGTTSGGLERLTPLLKRRIDIFIVELGINDAFLGISVDQIQRNLQEIIDRVRNANPGGVQVVIAGMQIPDYHEEGYVHDFGEMYADLATKNHAALVPYLLQGVGGNPLLNLVDRIHPNAAGQKVIAENVWAILEPIAREITGRRTAGVK